MALRRGVLDASVVYAEPVRSFLLWVALESLRVLLPFVRSPSSAASRPAYRSFISSSPPIGSPCTAAPLPPPHPLAQCPDPTRRSTTGDLTGSEGTASDTRSDLPDKSEAVSEQSVGGNTRQRGPWGGGKARTDSCGCPRQVRHRRP